jgi:cystathionine beta-lyase
MATDSHLALPDKECRMACDFDRVVNRCGTDSIKWCKYPPEALPLWVADMDFCSPEPVITALRERVEHGVFGYGKEPPELRPVLVERLQRLYGWQVAPEWLVFLPGVVIGFNLVCRAFASAGDGILLQTPAYPPILSAPQHAGCTCNGMELTRQADGQYTIDLDLFERTITDRTRVFILCNPHNPVGRVFTRQELQGMAEICLRHNLVICSDEIHCDFVYPGREHIPIGALDPEVGAHTITLMAPSKTFNIAGLHFAVAIVPDEQVRKRLCAAQDGLVHEPDILGYTASLAAYRDGQPWLEELMRYLAANRDFALEYVNERLRGIRAARPEGTYLLWLDCRQAGIPGNPQEFFLERARVALNDGPDYGQGGEGFLRLNFGCPRSTLAEALGRMEAALARL